MLSIDLPGHGERQDRGVEFAPWTAAPDIRAALDWAGRRMTSRQTAEEYVRQHNAKLTEMEGGERWFHIPGQVAVLREWEVRST